jgi:hypothetical protein
MTHLRIEMRHCEGNLSMVVRGALKEDYEAALASSGIAGKMPWYPL